jgi:ribosomal protein L37AE/L43A
MPEAYTRPDPSLLPIERPRCPKCQDRMRLRRIESGPDSSDLRTFECSKCGHIHKVLAEDPIKSAKATTELPVPMNAGMVR